MSLYLYVEKLCPIPQCIVGHAIHNQNVWICVPIDRHLVMHYHYGNIIIIAITPLQRQHRTSTLNHVQRRGYEPTFQSGVTEYTIRRYLVHCCVPPPGTSLSYGLCLSTEASCCVVGQYD